MTFKKPENKMQVAKTTGQLRTVLAEVLQGVLDGTVEIERATSMHKLAKNISESLYSETKIAMFRNEIGERPEKFGSLALGDPDA